METKKLVVARRGNILSRNWAYSPNSATELGCSRISRVLPYFAVHDENPAVEINVADVQGEGFTRPQASYGEQADQGLIGRGVQHRTQRAGGVDQRGNVCGREQIRGRPVVLARKKIRGRNLIRWVDTVQVGGKPADGTQAQPAIIRRCVDRLRRPCDRQLDRHVRCPERVDMVGELPYLAARNGQCEPQRATQRQVVLGGLTHGAHDPGSSSAGHGRTSVADAVRSTLA